MSRTGIPGNSDDTVNAQHLGIIHLAFGVETMEEVDLKAIELKEAGFPILGGPRKTGMGIMNLKHLILITIGWK